MNVGVGFALGAALTWGLASFLAGQACRRGTTLTVLLATQLAGLLTMAVITAATAVVGDGVRWSNWWQALPYSGLAGIAELLGFAALYRAMTRGPMGIAAPIAGLGVVVPVVFGLTTGSVLGHWQVLGLVLAAVGMVLLGVDHASIGFRNLGLAAASGVAFGIALVALAQGAAVDEVASSTLMRVATAPVLLVAFWCRQRQSGHGLHRMPLRPGALVVLPVVEPRVLTVLPWIWLGVAAGVSDVLGNLLFSVASTHTSLSVAALVASLDPVVTAVLARWCLAERLPRAGRWGAVAAVLGAALASAS